MRPLNIAIEGLRSFRSKVAIDFTDRTRVAIIGDTGAGKSSILEAMTYALYGQSSQGGHSRQELMNDLSDTMRVTLRFQVAGQEWEVTRVDRRSGEDRTLAEADLVCYGTEGRAIEKVERVRAVNARVQELIGLDSDAFLRTVILPQGRFARLLVEDRPADRTDVLRQLWPTRELERAGAAVEQRREEIERVRMRLGDEILRHPADPRAHLDDLSAKAKRERKNAEALAALRERARGVQDSLDRTLQVTDAAERVTAEVDPAAMDALESELEPLARAQTRIEAEAAKLAATEATLRSELADIPDDDGADLPEIVRTLAALEEAIPAGASAAIEAAAEAQRAEGKEAAAEEAARKAAEARAGADAQLKRHLEEEAPLQKMVDSVAKERRIIEELYGKAWALQERLGEVRDRLAGHKSALDGIRDRLREAESAEADARGAAGDAEAAFAQAMRANAAMAAAHDLSVGDPCPICTRTLPEGWTPPPDRGLDAVRAKLDAARAGLAKAQGEVAGRRSEEGAARQGIEALRQQHSGLGTELAEVLEPLGEAAGTDLFSATGDAPAPAPPPLPDRSLLLAATLQRLEAAEAALAAHRKETEPLRTAHTAATAAARATEVAHENATREAARTQSAATAALDALRHRIEAIALPFRPRIALPDRPAELNAVDLSPVEHARAAATERRETLARREEQRTRLQGEIEHARAQIDALKATRQSSVAEPLQTILQALNAQRDTVARVIRNEALRGAIHDRLTLPPALYRADPTEIGAAIDSLRRASQEARTLAAALCQRAAAEADESRAEAHRIALALSEATGASSPEDLDTPDDLDALLQSAASLASDADYAARTADRARATFAASLDDLLELHRAAREAADLERALGDLNAALKPGAFLKWLTLRRSRELLIAASHLLNEITQGRYSFADPGDQDDQRWFVIDNDSGQARTPASLSGGEQFIGSLALALGMVEMMARSGGRLESLFLDEGFGSLDRGNLDAAIEALQAVSGRGRMVGVISHLGAVAEQIDDVLAVTRTATGSRAEWLSQAQRRDLAQSDAGLEGAAALAGLLD